MKIEIKERREVAFSELRAGDFFLGPNGHLCFKCAGYDEDDNAFDLNNEYFTTYDVEFVTKVNSSKIKIIVED